MPRKKKVPRRRLERDERSQSDESSDNLNEAQLASPTKASSSTVGTGKRDVYRQQISPAKTETRTYTVIKTPSKNPLSVGILKLKLNTSPAVSLKSKSDNGVFKPSQQFKPRLNIETGESSVIPEVKEVERSKQLKPSKHFSTKENARKKEVLRWKRRLARAKRKSKAIEKRKDNLTKNEKIAADLLEQVINLLRICESLKNKIQKRRRKLKNVLACLRIKAELIFEFSENLKKTIEETKEGLENERISWKTYTEQCLEKLAMLEDEEQREATGED